VPQASGRAARIRPAGADDDHQLLFQWRGRPPRRRHSHGAALRPGASVAQAGRRCSGPLADCKDDRMTAINVPTPAVMQDESLRAFEDAAGRFFDQHATPERVAGWREAGMVEREFWREAGQAGLLGVTVPEAYGGAGADFRYDAVLFEQIIRK